VPQPPSAASTANAMMVLRNMEVPCLAVDPPSVPPGCGQIAAGLRKDWDAI
jgi:hypothetical protein